MATRPSTLSRAVDAWIIVVPLAALVSLALMWGRDLSGVTLVIALLLLGGAVVAAVHHAEVIAERVGEPFGSLVLAVAVTVIEVSLIVVLMVSSDSGKPTLARDTVFAAIMITCNGIVGLTILTSTWRGGVARFNPAGTGAGLASIVALAGLSLVLPTFTTSTPGPTFSSTQLTFAAIASLSLYLLYVFVQAVRHRDYFLAPPGTATEVPDSTPQHHGNVWASVSLLLVALVAVVGLGKVVSPSIEEAVADAGLPITVVAVAIALIVLLPESLAAWRSARRGQVQTSFNLAYGSAMASIGLTIPAVALASWVLNTQLQLGLAPVELVLLALTGVVSVLTVTPGRATLLQGGVHIAVFAGFLVLAFSP
jgi:Ca2+:H+ antiporter